MELQGTIVKKLSKKQKKKMEQTLANMEEIRIKDSVHLRQAMTNELAFLKSEKTKAIAEETKLRNKRLRIEGAIIIITKLLSEKKEGK